MSAGLQNGCIATMAPGKVNLCLHVGSKRKDGYHEIESLILPIGLADRVSLRREARQSRISVECKGFSQLENGNNLAVVAADWFFRKADIEKSERGLSIFIEKHIPLAAGLGGGSADAAAVLRLLQKEFDSPLSEKEMIGNCWEIGADLPACLARRSLWVSGIGERLGPFVTLPGFQLLLANPGYEVSTAWAYENCATDLLTNHTFGGTKTGKFAERYEIVALLCNDLEVVTFEEHPDLCIMKKAMVQVGALGALQTGSGPTIFGLFDERKAADNALARLSRKFPTWKFWLVSNYEEA